jgi:hydrogenase expression/formation protein HypC
MCLAVPGRVLRIADVDDTLMAEVDFGTVRKQVCMQYIPDVKVGEYVVVHVGFAIQRLDEQSARETLADFEKLGILEQEFGEGFALAAQQAGVDPQPGMGQPAPARTDGGAGR